MITNEKILELAQEHLEVLIADDDELNSPTDFAATREQLLKFANEVYNEGYEDGWESRADAECLNSSYPTGLVGEPQ